MGRPIRSQRLTRYKAVAPLYRGPVLGEALVAVLPLRLKIICFFENPAVNFFTFSTIRSPDKFSNEWQILELKKSKTAHFSLNGEIGADRTKKTKNKIHVKCSQNLMTVSILKL